LGIEYSCEPTRLCADRARFAAQSALSTDFQSTIREDWVAAGSRRVFEPEDVTLEDYSQIDIPFKLPGTLGRVIGEGANLNVSGSEQITFGGQSRYRVNEPITERGPRSKFPTLDMKQHLRIDLNGTVGEKIHVMVHHDSEIDTPLENRIKLRYEGHDDEIVQSIEMGNTTLSIPGSEFVSYSGQQKGLFGAKLLAKMGPLDLTAIASKQEGRTAGASFEGAATRDSVVISDVSFLRNKYFFMVDPLLVDLQRSFAEVTVYMDDGDGNNNEGEGTLEGWAFLTPPSLEDTTDWDLLKYKGNFDVLERNRDYVVDLVTGEVQLLRSLESSHVLAVEYTYGGVQVGGVDAKGRLVLKMIRPADQDMVSPDSPWRPTLELMRRNVYSLQAAYISEEQVEVKIFRRGSPDRDIQIAQTYARILGVDLKDENGNVPAPGEMPDGYADGGTVNGEQGLLLFPDLRPFDPNYAFVDDRPETLLTDNKNPDLYNQFPGELQSKPNEYSKFYIVVRYSTPQTTFKLPHINILEGSDVVELNGRRLARNVDYEIYYDIGQIRFKTDEVASADAKISVDYQYVPFLALAQQSLLGGQAVYQLSQGSHVGTAWLFQSKKSPEERPRLGQEPSEIIMGDVNAQFDLKPDMLTEMVDALPFVEANAPSRLTMSGEIGMSLPNPNTKGSVYIDDMEGVSDLRTFSMMRESWVPASPSDEGLEWRDNRRLWWYVKDREVREQDLFPNAESRPGESFIPVLELNFREFAYDTLKQVIPDPEKAWGGLMRLVSKSGADYSDLRFVEVWVRQKSGQGGRMHVDLGALSENFYRPWKTDSLHSEDKDGDGKLSTDENTGYDGVFTGQEGDDPFDDWSYTEGDYSQINGTEGNPRTLPDTEDLDGDGNLDTDNVHFRLEFDLGDTSYIANQSGDWYQYRVPLAEADTIGGAPTWKSIRYIRFSMSGVDSGDVFQVAYLQIAGTGWLQEGIRRKEDMAKIEPGPDEVFEISAKNTRDDPDYVPPFDPGKDPQGYSKREQSLVFNFRNLRSGNSGSVYRNLPGNPGNYTLYKTLSFYVHGDAQAAAQDLYLFLRIGSDSVNFYEYATRIEPGWRTVNVPLADITNLKTEEGDSTTIYGRRVIWRKAESANGWTSVYGAPSITRISRISTGVVNLGDAPTYSSGTEVWLDDIRLTDVRKDAGFAKRLRVRAAFSDFITVSGDYRNIDTEFQTLSGTRSGSDDTDYTISSTVSAGRMIPWLGLAVPFSMRYHRMRSLPTLKSQSDITLREDQRAQEQRTSVDDTYRLSIGRRAKSTNSLLRLTVDALSASVSYSRKRGESPILADTSSSYNGNLGYKVHPWWDHTLRLFKGYGVSYLPDRMDFTVNGSTRDVKQIDRVQNVVKEDRYTRQIRGIFSLAAKPLVGPAIETDYTFKMTRDLDTNKRLPIISSIGLGIELDRSQRAGIRIRRSLGDWLRPTLSYDVNYDENADPKLRLPEDPPGVRKASASSRSTVDVILAPATAFTAAHSPEDSIGPPAWHRVMSKFPDVSLSYLLDRKSKYNKLSARPNLAFQFGLTPVVDEEIILRPSSGAAQQSDDLTRTNGFNASTEFRPHTAVSVNAAFRWDHNTRTYAGSKTFTSGTVWPDVTGSVSAMLPLESLKKVLKTSSFSSGYKATSDERGEGESSVLSRTTKSEWLPLLGWDTTWQNGVRTTFNIRRSSSETQDFKGAGSMKRSQSTAVNFSLRHSFSAPQGMYIPLAGRTLRFQSNLSVSLDINYELQKDTTPTANDRVDANTRKIAVLPKASYSFSKNITGTANARFEETTDRKLGQKWRTIGMNVSVLIRF
jgi:hypothetical protein